jgi:hypothetical protein
VLFLFLIYERGIGMTTQEKTTAEKLQGIGECAMDSIREMVAALECDYDRLQELRDERDGWEPDEDDEDSPATWAECHVEDAKELAELEEAAGDCEDQDDARQRIEEDPLSLEVRSDWHAPGSGAEDTEFCLLLGTGGPAVRIIGELESGRPTSAKLQTQDWFTSWTDVNTSIEDDDALLTYCNVFYFGD